MIRTMISLALRWSAPMLALFVLGPLAALLMRDLHGPLGGDQFTFFIGHSFGQGLVVMLSVFGLALVAGVLGSWIDNPHAGLTCSGIVFAWAASQTGQIDGILRATQSNGTLTTLALEGAILAIVGVVMAWVVLRAGAKRTPPDHVLEHVLPKGDPMAYGGLSACIITALIMAYLVARDPMKGQAVAGAAIAGLVGAMVARMSSPRTPALLYVAGIAALAAASPILASLLSGSQGAVVAARSNHLFRAGNILPLDWLAGAFIGIPIGLSWAASMLHKEPSALPARG